VCQFADWFLERVDAADLTTRNPEDDASAVIDTWKRFQRRDPNEVQVQVANPVHARDGWQSQHTIVRLMTRDMPFVVDSVLIALCCSTPKWTGWPMWIWLLSRHGWKAWSAICWRWSGISKR
jgi:NAD-specific glutamate dehydrogenase